MRNKSESINSLGKALTWEVHQRTKTLWDEGDDPEAKRDPKARAGWLIEHHEHRCQVSRILVPLSSAGLARISVSTQDGREIGHRLQLQVYSSGLTF